MGKYLGYDQTVVRTADSLAVMSSVAQALDSELNGIDVFGGETYHFEAWLRVISPAAADIDIAFSLPAGSTGEFYNASVPSAAIDIDDELTVATDGANEMILIMGYFVAGADGDFGLTWAQNVSNDGETKVLAGSKLLARNAA